MKRAERPISRVMVEVTTDGSARKARFVHFSVQEFLLAHSVGFDNQSTIGFDLIVEPQRANSEIATMCIVFLLHCRIKLYGTYGYPQPIHYTIRGWMLHARALKAISIELRDLILSLFDSGFLYVQEDYHCHKDPTGLLVYYFHRVSGQVNSLLDLALVYELPLLVEHLTRTNHSPLYIRTTMHLAAKLNAGKVIEYLCSKDCDVNALDQDGYTPLFYAGGEEACQALIRNGADLHIEGGDLGNPLHAAASGRREAVVRCLLEAGFDVNTFGGSHGYALNAAARQGHKGTVEILLEFGANVNVNGGGQGSALEIASYRGELAVVELLLAHGADVNAGCGRCGSALQAASLGGELAVVELLLAHGADVNAGGGEYRSALQAASLGGELAVVELLLAHGADVNAGGGEYGSALQAASYCGALTVVKLLLTHGADINTQGGKHGFALHAAATPRYSKELVKYLLDEGADVNATGGRDGSALQAAARKGKKECVEILLANGANANTQGGKYGSALKAASSKQYHEIVRILIDHGAYDMPETETEGSSLDTLSVQDVGTEANPIQQAVDTECEQAEQQNLSPTPRRVKRDWRP